MLEKRKDIIVRPADKGGGVVLLSKEFYHGQIMDMLSDEATYRTLDKDPTQAYRDQLKVLVDLGSNTGVLSDKEKRFLLPSSSQIPTLYTLPKVHKDLENPPARPIVNSIDPVSSRMGQYLDQFLQKSVVSTRSYLRDTKNFLNSLQTVELAGRQ